jgi:hypothetical protein
MSPWRIFGLATIAGIVTLWDLARGASADHYVLGVFAVSGLVLYGAAALAAVIEGIRLGKAGDPVAAVADHDRGWLRS